MSFLDSVIAAVSGELGGGGQQAPVQAGLQLIEQHGGVQGVVDTLRSGGLKDEVESWVGTGGNLPVSADTLQQVPGNSPVQAPAAKYGLDTTQLSQGLASVLPQLIDKAIPDSTFGGRPRRPVGRFRTRRQLTPPVAVYRLFSAAQHCYCRRRQKYLETQAQGR